MNQLNWNDIRYFLALVDGGSLSAAARELKVEHTTIARRVEALEAELQLRLFDRLPRGWTLTEEGNGLLPYARGVEQHMLDLARAASGAEALAGAVRISAPPALSTYLLAPHLRALLGKLPNIEIELAGEARDASLTRREADIALRLSRPRASGLVVKSLATIQYGLYATTAYLDAHEPQSWRFLGYDDSLRESPQQRWLEELAAQRPFAMRANDLSTIYQAALASVGVAVLPHFLGRISSELIFIKAGLPAVDRTLWLVMHDDVRRSPRVRAVADQLINLFECEPVQSLVATVAA